MDKNSTYNANSIEVLSGLDPVRKRPGMYTDTKNPNYLAQEVIDNSVDEAIAGFAKNVDVILYEDDSIEVTDDGRGMPTDVHPKEQISGVELILTRLHAGAKFSDKTYTFSGGLHGVGISVVNALSKKLEATIKQNGKIYKIVFQNGEKTTDLHVIGKAKLRETGTRVRFWPSEEYFDSIKFSITNLTNILRSKAFLCPGLKISFINKLTGENLQWVYDGGLFEYLKSVLSEGSYIPDDLFVGNFRNDLSAIDWAIAWSTENASIVTESYVNSIPTTQGGTHVNGLRTGLLEAMRDFCEMRKIIPKNVRIMAEDIWENCCYILSIKMKNPQFLGQIKERLTSRESASFVASVVRDAFSLWLNKNIFVAEKIANLIIENSKKRLQESKQITRKRIASGPALPGKLADCISCDRDQTELFLVEGESAGGSAKQARDRETQAVMPLRGKILNTWEINSREVLLSQEVRDISIAINVSPGSQDISQLRYGKICILADADSDGLHIATLLCALFLKHFRALVVAGHVYLAMPPLYRIDKGKEVYYAIDDDEKNAILKKIQSKTKHSNINVQRFKGLGEMNPLQLRETTMYPNTRRLIMLTIENEIETCELIDMLLAKKRATDRKVWLENKGNMAEI